MHRLMLLWSAVRRVLSHWSTERGTLRQGATALTICITVTLFAGIILGEMEGVLADTPGLLVLVPSAIGMRGAIFGALGARLGTGMLTGQFTVDLRRGSFTADNVEAALLLSLSTAVLTAALASGMSALFGLDAVDLFQLVIVSVVGALVSSGIVLAVTLALARTAQARSWDMDAIGTPVISATADISTLPALLLGVLLLGVPAVHVVVGGVLILAAVAAAVYGLRHPNPPARRIVAESTPVLGYAAVMGVLAGTVLETRLDTLIADPALLVAIPPFIASSGALGGILSARLSSQLHIGLLEPAALPDRRAMLEGSITGLLGLIGFTVVGLATRAGAAAFDIASPGTGALVGAVVIGGLLSVAVVFVVAYYAATASFRFGLDPDTSSIPIVTSSIDFLGILCLVIGIAVVGLS